jgi:hypothetical protein
LLVADVMGLQRGARPLTRALSWLVLAHAGACSSFAPPIRSTHHGTAGRLSAGEVELSGAGNYFGSGGPTLSYGATPELALEAGSDLRLVDDTRWALGFAGVRTTLNGRVADSRGDLAAGPAADAALGFGLGVGGQRNPDADFGDDADTRDSFERAAGGGYLQLGGAWHLTERAAMFSRASVQATTAQGIPTTAWWSFVLGPELTYDVVSVYACTGIAGYADEAGHAEGWYPIEVGGALRFDLAADRKRLITAR